MGKKNTRNTKGRIIQAAWRLFYQQGYDDTTVDEIIRDSLNGVKLDHRIGDRRSCRKHCPTPSGQFVQVPCLLYTSA